MEEGSLNVALWWVWTFPPQPTGCEKSVSVDLTPLYAVRQKAMNHGVVYHMHCTAYQVNDYWTPQFFELDFHIICMGGAL